MGGGAVSLAEWAAGIGRVEAGMTEAAAGMFAGGGVNIGGGMSLVLAAAVLTVARSGDGQGGGEDRGWGNGSGRPGKLDC